MPEGAPQKDFTLAEANAALPELVARIGRLRELRDEIRRGREFLDILWQRLDSGESILSAIGERQSALDEFGEEFGRLVREIEGWGVILRDLDPGLVDFPSAVRGIPIFLCWRTGEPRIGFWHGRTEGFAGRKPIATIEDEAGPRVN